MREILFLSKSLLLSVCLLWNKVFPSYIKSLPALHASNLSRYHSYPELIFSYPIFIFVMTHIKDHIVKLYYDSGNKGSSHLVKTETSSILDSNLLVNSYYAPIIINVPDSYETRRFSGGSFDIKITLDESSFDVLIFYDDARSDRAVSSTSTPSAAVRDSAFPDLTSLKVDVIVLNREEARTFI